MGLEENINNNAEITFKNNNDIITKLINLITENNLIFDNSFPLLFDRNYHHLSFLNNKNTCPKPKFENNNENLFGFYEYEKSSVFDKKVNFKNVYLLSKKLKNSNNYINKIDISNTILPKVSDEYQFNLSKLDIKNKAFKKNNLYKIENSNYIYIDKSISKKDKLKSSNINKDINIKENKNNNHLYKNSYIKGRIFLIEKKSNIISNEIKVKKNNKMIFMNKCLIKQKKKNNDIIPKKKQRKSFYRGVSKNGKSWQTIISSKYFKGYIGTYPTEELAARVYDLVSIKNKGIRAKTNFQYNLHQIQKISEAIIDFKAKNIEEIILNLIN